MQVQIVLPDDVAHSLEHKWGNLDRKLLEMLTIEAYCDGAISVGKVRELLGLSTRLEADAWLKAKGIDLSYDLSDFEADCLVHEQLRQSVGLTAS